MICEYCKLQPPSAAGVSTTLIHESSQIKKLKHKKKEERRVANKILSSPFGNVTWSCCYRERIKTKKPPKTLSDSKSMCREEY